jgi:hypothetical protein
MRDLTDAAKLRRFLEELGRGARSSGNVYLVGGASAVLIGWRGTTVDIDLKLDPEPAGVFSLIGQLKDTLNLNVELASPDHFIPAVPGWAERSVPVGRFGQVSVFHYDFVGQALAKIERGHDRDLLDVRAMLDRGLVTAEQLRDGFARIAPLLERYPHLDADTFEAKVNAFLVPS